MIQLRRAKPLCRATPLTGRDLVEMDADLVEQLIVANAAWDAADAERVRKELDQAKRGVS